MSDGQDDWIKWQMSDTGNTEEIALWPPEGMSYDDVERISALHILVGLCVYACISCIAIIVGIVLLFFGAL